MTFRSSAVIGRAGAPTVAVAVAMRCLHWRARAGHGFRLLEAPLTACLRQSNAGLRETESALTTQGETRNVHFTMRRFGAAAQAVRVVPACLSRAQDAADRSRVAPRRPTAHRT